MAGLPLFRTFTARVMTVVMGTVIAFSAALGLSVYFMMTAWQADSALEFLSALATARQQAMEAEVSRYLGAGNAFAAPDLGYEIEQLQAAEGAKVETMRKALLGSMHRKLRSNELLESAQVVDLENRVLVQTQPGSDPYLDVAGSLFREAVLRPVLSTPKYGVTAAPT